MQKKGLMIAIAVVVIGAAVAAVLVMTHKSSNTSNTSSSSKTSTSQAAAVNNAVVTTKTDSSLGQYLADPKGMALYTYSADSSGTSNCSGSCLTTWPAYEDSAATTDLPADVTTIKRSDDGKMQFAYKGMPLYYFVSDSSGQVSGDGVGGFHVAKP